jgi:hypothetical protein
MSMHMGGLNLFTLPSANSFRASPASVPQSVPQRDLGRVEQKNIFSCVLQSLFLFGAVQYVVRCPEPVSATQGTLGARQTQRKARRGVAGPMRQWHIQV